MLNESLRVKDYKRIEENEFISDGAYVKKLE